MNIFLPYERDFKKCAQSLDDKRLNKQIIECIQLLNIYEKICSNNGIKIIGYSRHPIFLHYSKNILHICAVIKYCKECCDEYYYRFSKNHMLEIDMKIYKEKYIDFLNVSWSDIEDTYQPFYMEGAIKSPTHIRTYENVSYLYKNKLINKWLNSKHIVKWTNRDTPEFFADIGKIS